MSLPNSTNLQQLTLERACGPTHTRHNDQIQGTILGATRASQDQATAIRFPGWKTIGHNPLIGEFSKFGSRKNFPFFEKAYNNCE